MINLDGYWGLHPIRVFVSYADPDREQAQELQSCLDNYMISTFVARKDIRAGSKGVDTIRCALSSMHAFVPLLSQKHIGRYWTNQEVGFAFARDVLITPVKLADQNPVGFIENIQAVEWEEKGCEQVAAEITTSIFRHGLPSSLLIDTLVKMMQNVHDTTQVVFVTSLLPHITPPNTIDIKPIMSAFNSNIKLFSQRNIRETFARELTRLSDHKICPDESETHISQLTIKC